jgi:hypothetical protein
MELLLESVIVAPQDPIVQVPTITPLSLAMMITKTIGEEDMTGVEEEATIPMDLLRLATIIITPHPLLRTDLLPLLTHKSLHRLMVETTPVEARIRLHLQADSTLLLHRVPSLMIRLS